MKRLREKWNSSRGASILIALLLMLVCMMVASSVLMAAASNGGKLSSREEHQKYLTLSSALRLVCGEIEGSSYVGEYSYSFQEITKTVQVEETDENGNPVITEREEHDYNRYTYTQAPGDYTSELSDVLPLRDQLDYLFGKKLAAGAGVVQEPADQYVFEKRSLNYYFPITFKLTVEAKDFADVTVAFALREDGVITLTASLPAEGGHVYAMEAELVPVEPLDRVFLLKNLENTVEVNQVAYDQTDEVKWKLNWIAKKGA